MSNPSGVKAEGLGQRFDRRWIFRDLSFDVITGSAFVILGPSGAGKSVLLKTLTGLMPPAEGRCILGTEDFSLVFQKNKFM